MVVMTQGGCSWHPEVEARDALDFLQRPGAASAAQDDPARNADGAGLGNPALDGEPGAQPDTL